MLARLRTSAGRLVEALPEPLSLALRPSRYRYSRDDRPDRLTAPPATRRLLIGRANFAAQGYRIARAVDTLEDAGAVCLHVLTANARFGFPADVRVPQDIFQHSAHWRRETFKVVSTEFSHVIVEAGRSMLGKLFEHDPLRELEAFRAAGLAVALAAYGSELRLPSRHKTIDKWSPFNDEDWPAVPALEDGARRFRALAAASQAPVFVATPDQLLDWPEATWLPVGIDPDRWSSSAPVLDRARPVVVHAPTNPRIKGTHLVEPVLERLSTRGLIEYRRLEGVPFEQMPAFIGDADIVLDQFRIGTYSVAAVEGMAAGRVVVAHLHDQVRSVVSATSGMAIPIATAAPDQLEDLLYDITLNRDAYRTLAKDGPRFAREVHNGEMMARALTPFVDGRLG